MTTMSEGQSRVKPLLAFKAEVAVTSETMAMLKNNQFIRAT